mmetsp:Transcript_29834/g.78132  ORF Transcript_29834/g.78132 Transcript_29834/m.78132 type:complete len:218 (+) Transcript_29834:413-1066(+)
MQRAAHRGCWPSAMAAKALPGSAARAQTALQLSCGLMLAKFVAQVSSGLVPSRIGPASALMVPLATATSPLTLPALVSTSSLSSSSWLRAVTFSASSSDFLSASVATWPASRLLAWPALAATSASPPAAAPSAPVRPQTRCPSGSTEQTCSCHALARPRRPATVWLASASAAAPSAAAPSPASRAMSASSLLSPHECISKRLLLTLPPHISSASPSH